MTRFFSFLAAIIVFASASAEIASFVIDHKSWLQENYKAARDYVTIPAPARPDQPTPPQQPCAANCTPTAAVPPQKDDAHRCDGIEPLGKKILCHITLPKADTACRKDCEQKSKPGLPGNLIRPDKGSMASVSRGA
jgi:hypothetical protein